MNVAGSTYNCHFLYNGLVIPTLEEPVIQPVYFFLFIQAVVQIYSTFFCICQAYNNFLVKIVCFPNKTKNHWQKQRQWWYGITVLLVEESAERTQLLDLKVLCVDCCVLWNVAIPHLVRNNVVRAWQCCQYLLS